MGREKFDLEYVAKLARINLNEGEIDKFSPQLSRVLDYIDKLDELNTEEIPPTTHVMDIKNVLREDEVKQPLDREEVLKNVPEKEDGFFKVPKVI